MIVVMLMWAWMILGGVPHLHVVASHQGAVRVG